MTLPPPPVKSPPTFQTSSSSQVPVDLNPPLIAMVVFVFTAFIVVSYFRVISRHLLPPIIHLLRRWKLRWRLYRYRRSYVPSAGGDIGSPTFESGYHFESVTTGFHWSPYGLDDTIINNRIPLSIYTKTTTDSKKGSIDFDRECAVCLLELEENDYIRTLPVCSHTFHVDCIDIWLRAHANCPLCRSRIFRSESPFIPLMAARIRPRLDDIDLSQQSVLPENDHQVVIISPTTTTAELENQSNEIGPDVEDSLSSSSSPVNEIDLQYSNERKNFLLKRSYSFGFERNFVSDHHGLMAETATASPWRYSRRSFWNKRSSPFGSLSKSRVFSLRYYRGMKSPFFRRRGGGGGSMTFFPLSESSNSRYFSGGGGYSRRSKSLTSPFFGMRTSGVFSSSSRLRCGDPEALLSPERLTRR